MWGLDPSPSRCGSRRQSTAMLPYARGVRDLETIDAELRLLAAVRRVCREHGGGRCPVSGR